MIRKSGYGFPKRSCSTNKLERDDDSKKSHRAPAPAREQLRESGPQFIGGGEAHKAQHRFGRKCLNHPERGVLQFVYSSFQANDDPSLKLVIYTPL
jgi:hypothetical protein